MEDKLKILLCEDDENLGMLLREYLQAKDYDADTLKNYTTIKVTVPDDGQSVHTVMHLMLWKECWCSPAKMQNLLHFRKTSRRQPPFTLRRPA